MTADARHGMRTAWGWGLAGLALIAVQAAILLLSPRFLYGTPILERPTVAMVGLMMTAGAVYCAAMIFLDRPVRPRPGWWLWVIAAGLVMRALMMPSTPILEDDYFRYLWDGAVVANGHNPYAHSPAGIQRRAAPEELISLAEDSGPVIERVNHPSLRTIYPVTAQAAFALAHLVMPWRIEGLRLVWLVFDAATIMLLAALLHAVGLPRSGAVVYWWNPLLVNEVYNSAHMEVLIFPFLLGALLLCVNNRAGWGGGMLGLATGAKVWPVILLPALARVRGASFRRHAVMLLGCVAVSAALAAPLLFGGTGDDSGLGEYSRRWQMNDLIYMLIHWTASQVSPDQAHFWSRGVVILLLGGWLLWLCRTPATTGRQVCERALWTIAALFMLSPTQFPWYALWFLPLLAVRPSPGLLILTAMLPMYYLRFPMRELGTQAWFDYGLIWIQFGPTLALLAWEGLKARKSDMKAPAP